MERVIVVAVVVARPSSSPLSSSGGGRTHPPRASGPSPASSTGPTSTAATPPGWWRCLSATCDSSATVLREVGGARQPRRGRPGRRGRAPGRPPPAVRHRGGADHHAGRRRGRGAGLVRRSALGHRLWAAVAEVRQPGRAPSRNWASPTTSLPRQARNGGPSIVRRVRSRHRGALSRPRAHRQPGAPRPQGPPPGHVPRDAVVAHHPAAACGPLLVHLHGSSSGRGPSRTPPAPTARSSPSPSTSSAAWSSGTSSPPRWAARPAASPVRLPPAARSTSPGPSSPCTVLSARGHVRLRAGGADGGGPDLRRAARAFSCCGCPSSWLVVTVLSFGGALILSAVTVFLRDVAHSIGIVPQAVVLGDPGDLLPQLVGGPAGPDPSSWGEPDDRPRRVLPERGGAQPAPELGMLAYDTGWSPLVCGRRCQLFGRWQRLFAEIMWGPHRHRHQSATGSGRATGCTTGGSHSLKEQVLFPGLALRGVLGPAGGRPGGGGGLGPSGSSVPTARASPPC